jgi:hypothetical protein
MPGEAGASSYWELAVEMCGARASQVGLLNRLLDEIL